MTEATTENGSDAAENAAETSGEQKTQEQTFTQADVDKIVRDRLAQQAKNKFGDYDELKTRAEGARTLEERLADVESRYKDAETKALRSDIAAQFGISAEDRDLFLIGSDEETLTSQARRLAERDGELKKHGNVARSEGGSSDALALNGDGLENALRNALGIS